MNERSSPKSERDLMKRVAKGDEKAFREIYDLTYGKVAFYLYRLVSDQALVEDVLVETYAAVWKGAKSFKGNAKVSTWIIGIARNLAMNELRKTRIHEDIDDHSGLSNGSQPDPESLDRRELLEMAMNKLSSNHREILDLVFFHEMNYPEVSSLLKIPVSTVKTRVFYAKDALKKGLQQMGVSQDDL